MDLSKVDIRPIIRAHFASLKDARSGRTMLSDWAIHLGAPSVAAVGAFLAGVELTNETKAVLITAIALFGGLLFNLLVLASGLRLAARGSFLFGDSKLLSRQLLANIEYSILLAFLGAAVLLPSMITIPRIPSALATVNEVARRVCYAISVGSLVGFGVAMLMVVRRMHIAMTKNLEIAYEEAPNPVARTPRRMSLAERRGVSQTKG